MDITASLVDFLINRYGAKAIDVLTENALYYILGDRFITFDEDDLINKQKSKVVMTLNKNTLLNICDMFQDNDISYIGFKGVILSNLLYNNSTSRNVGDIDIFVDKTDFERAYVLLLDIGYRLQNRESYENQHHVVMQNGTSVVELHRSIINPDMNIDESYIRDNRETIRISDKCVNTFNLTATLLHLLYHLYMDICLEDTIIYDFFAKKQYPKVRRFLYRAYEIALFAEKYYDRICWDDIANDIQHQRLRVCFKKMIQDIAEIFPDLFPDSLLKNIYQLHYVEDYRDRLYKYLTNIEAYNCQCIDEVLSNYIEDNWEKRSERNICKTVGDSFELVKHSSKTNNQRLSCFIVTQKKEEGLELSFCVSDENLCITENSDYDTLTSDGIHLLLCGTNTYSYYSVFFFPKEIDSTIKVVVYDVLNDRIISPDEHMIGAELQLTDEGYIINAFIYNDFIIRNHWEFFFYMGLIISDCNNKTHSRESELVLSEDDSLWYDPTYFAKILLNN